MSSPHRKALWDRLFVSNKRISADLIRRLRKRDWGYGGHILDEAADFIEQQQEALAAYTRLKDREFRALNNDIKMLRDELAIVSPQWKEAAE